MIRTLYLLFLLSGLSLQARGQDASYWQNGYSAFGRLMPGSTIISDNDSGAYYYNPAVNAVHPKTSVSLSGNFYQYSRTNIQNSIGSGKTLKKGYARIVPMMVGGTVLLSRARNITLGYALVTRQPLYFQATQREDQKKNVLNDSYSPGDEFFVGQYSYTNSRSQTFGSASVAYKPARHWAVGITAEPSYTQQTMTEAATSRALLNVDTTSLTIPVTSVEQSYQIDYWHIGLRFKAGLSYDRGPHHIGLLITTPMINFGGRASMSSDLMLTHIRLNPDSDPVDMLANGRQTKLPVKYKMPFSIALAYGMDFERGQVALTGEYFAGLNSYEIVSPRNASFMRPDTGFNNTLTKEFLRFSEARKSVVNIGIGMTYRLQRFINLYGSLATNFAFTPEDLENTKFYSGNDPNMITWNTYNLQFGAGFRRQRMNMRAGIMLSYGRTGNIVQPLNFDNATDENLLLGETQYTQAYYLNSGIVLSYIHNF